MLKSVRFMCLFASWVYLITNVEAFRPRSANKVPQTVQVFDVNLLQVSKELRLKAFSWSSCSGPNASLSLTKLELPDVITLPGVITVSLAANLARDLVAPIKTAVQLKKKVAFLWIDVPCVENLGSCNYDDLCSIIPYPPQEPCPDFFIQAGIPCNCPAQKGDYAVQKGGFPVPKDPLPAFLEKGQYSLRVNVGSNEGEVMCLKVYIELA